MARSRTPNEIGDDFEDRVKRALGGERVKQSGGGKFWKLDVRDRWSFVWSCKATTRGALRITGDMIREAKRAARGVVGTGDKFKWGIAVEIDGEAGVFVPLDDFAEMLTAEPESGQHIPAGVAKTRTKRAMSSPMSR